MGKFMLCIFCLWGSFFLLTVSFIACKPLARQDVSDISAISDAKLALGVVLIQRDDGKHAYRMLLCKKAEVYPLSMLTDNSRCRVALYDRSGAEVAFMPNEFKRDVGTKYKGYAKKATILTLAIVPFAILGGRVGMRRHIKKLEAFRSGEIDLIDVKAGKFKADLINKDFSSSGWEFYRTEWGQQFNAVIKVTSDEQVTAEAIRGVISYLDGFPNNLATAAELKVGEDSKKLLSELVDLPAEQRVARFAELEEEIKSLNNGVLHDQDGSFWREFDQTKARFAQLIEEAQSEDKSIEELRSIIDELGQVGEVYRKDILRYWEVENKMTIMESRTRLGKMVSVNDKIIANNKESLLKAEQNTPLRFYVEREITKLAARDKDIGAVGGAGLVTTLLLAIDKSIWGYADRQVSKHWNQIFVENDGFKDVHRVKDVRFILQTLADRFGYIVSQRALQLGN